MKFLKIFSLIFCFILLTTILAVPTSAASSKVIYENDFSGGDSDIDNTFDVYCGILTVVEEKGNKFLRCTQESAKVHFAYGPTEERNIDISLKIRATTINDNNNSRMEVMFRSPHIPAWETVCYSLQMKTYQSSLIFADRFADANERLPLLDSTDFRMKSGLWNNVQISTRGERIIIYVNGNLLFEYKDNQYAEEGGVGFSAASMSFDVDDIVITKHYGTSLPEPSANEKPEWAGDISEQEEPDIADTGVIRIDLTTLGQEKVAVNNAIHFINPFELTVYTWIALAVALVCLFGAVVGWLLLARYKKITDKEGV